MTQNDLNRAVALATGETVCTISRLGFSLAEPDFAESDPELNDFESRTVDWDALDEQRVALLPA